MRKARRKISHSKMYGFHPWQDQVDAVDLIAKETGMSESIVLRKLLDEALIARRRLIADQEVLQPSSARRTAKASSDLENLILRVIKQNSTSLRVQDITLALVQETLAEARAGRNLDWAQFTSALEEQGLTRTQIEQRFEQESETAKDFAYGVAQAAKAQQEQ